MQAADGRADQDWDWPAYALPVPADWPSGIAATRVRAREGVHAATLGVHGRRGQVFASGTTGWVQVLAGGRDRRVETITRNVLDGLLQ